MEEQKDLRAEETTQDSEKDGEQNEFVLHVKALRMKVRSNLRAGRFDPSAYTSGYCTRD
jgi:hypothetical protein